MLPIGTPVCWTFPASGRIYYGAISEQHPAKRSGDEERYRIKGANFDCFAFRRDLEVI